MTICEQRGSRWNRMQIIFRRYQTDRVALGCLLVLHAALLVFCAMRHSFCWTESGLLPSGIIDWQYGDFAAYRVNPPLLRMWATLPLLALDIDIPYYGASTDPRHRPEWDLAQAMFQTYGTRTWAWLTVARMMCLPFCLIGMSVAARWAGELFGREAGLAAAALWAFSPWMLGYGCLMSGDAQAASMGLVALYTFRHWTKNVSLESSWLLGVAVGIAVLMKFSWLILFGLLPLMWAVIRCGQWLQRSSKSSSWAFPSWAEIARQTGLATFGCLTCLLVINLAYGFQGTGISLGDFEFISKALAGTDGWQPDFFSGNRFRDGWLGAVPMPFPEDMIIGLDLQKWDFDRERSSYFMGEWRNFGWWYYYVFGLAVKTPIGTLLLLLIAIVGVICRRSWRESWEDALVLCLPVAVILLLASAETGLNRHTRYVLPVVPLLIILSSRSFLAVKSPSLGIRWLVCGCLAWTVFSSLGIYPHSHNYFNELIGGPRNASKYMNASNLDWGQDLKAVKGWCEQHPEKRPVFVSSYPTAPNPNDMQIPATGRVPTIPPFRTGWRSKAAAFQRFPSGWYVIDAENLIRQQGDYRYLENVPVDEYIGSAFRVFHVTEKTALRLQRQFHDERPSP